MTMHPERRQREHDLPSEGPPPARTIHLEDHLDGRPIWRARDGNSVVWEGSTISDLGRLARANGWTIKKETPE